MKALPSELKFQDMPSIKVQWQVFKETLGKGDLVYKVWIPVPPSWAIQSVPKGELAKNVIAEAAGRFIKLSSEDLSRLELSDEEIGVAATVVSLENKLAETGRAAESDEKLVELAERIHGKKVLPGDGLKKLDEISFQITEEDVDEESPAEAEGEDEPITARTLKKILAERELPSWRGKSPLSMNKEELALFKEDNLKNARERDELEHSKNLKMLPANKTAEELEAEDPSPFARGEVRITKSPYDMSPEELKAFRESHGAEV
jgi:hypothetical protein